MRHIGILAHSADGATACFLEIVRESARWLGAHAHPEITVSIRAMGPTLAAYASGDLAFVNEYLRRTAENLAACGCDFFICPDNTAHMAFEALTEPYPLPGLHISHIVARQAQTEHRKRVALLGTRWTMEGDVYPEAFSHAGVALEKPNVRERELIDRVIFDELCQGVLSEDSRKAFVAIIEKMRGEGCDAVALSCTEIPLLITPDVSPLPTLDSTRLLAHAAVAVAIGDQPLPIWRGGSYTE